MIFLLLQILSSQTPIVNVPKNNQNIHKVLAEDIVYTNLMETQKIVTSAALPYLS